MGDSAERALSLGGDLQMRGNCDEPGDNESRGADPIPVRRLLPQDEGELRANVINLMVELRELGWTVTELAGLVEDAITEGYVDFPTKGEEDDHPEDG